MKRGVRGVQFYSLVAVVGILCLLSSAAFAKDPIKLKVSHQPEFESFLTWQAIQDGTQKKHNLNMEMVYFDSGMPQVEALQFGPERQTGAGYGR